MSKLAAYLRGHVTGEVSTRVDVRESVANDMGVLTLMPEMVIYPRSTNDVRKVARFSWQLAEKGHGIPITPRGAGTDAGGAAIGKGISLVTTSHMSRIFEYDAKQRLIRLQPGVTVAAVNQALSLYGAAITSLVGSHNYGTVGGAIASAVTGRLAGKYGTIERSVEQLEVVLANGDVIQTGRISKRELERRKGVQGFEGDIYRGIDGIIDEYGDVLDNLRSNDAAGYNTIADVKQKDGSFDLTPLFIGSQGTLGVISEIIMRAELRSHNTGVAALVFSDENAARDALDQLCGMSPAFVEYFDAELFEIAKSRGREYGFYKEATEALESPASVILVGYDDFGDRHRRKHLAKVQKLFAKSDDVHVTTTEAAEHPDELMAALDVAYYTGLPDNEDEVAPSLFSGFHIPTERLEDFVNGLRELAKKDHTSLPLAGHAYTNTYAVYPQFNLRHVSDKQRLIKLIDQLTQLVYKHDGTMIAEGGEGRLKTHSIYAQLDERVVEMYEAVRKVCDPYDIMNPGVKQQGSLAELAKMVRSHPEAGQLARFGLYS